MKMKKPNRKKIISAIYNELSHSSKLQHWQFKSVAKDLLDRLVKIGIIDEEFGPTKEEIQKKLEGDAKGE